MEIRTFNGIEFQTAGKGMPIIFLHGLFLDKTSTKNFFEKKVNIEAFRRIYLDLPGMGNSSTISKISTDAIFNNLIKFIDHIVGDEMFAVYGHSFGGYLAQAIAYHYQSQVSGLFLTCPVVVADKELRVTENHKNHYIEKVNVRLDDPSFRDFEEMNVLISNASWSSYQKLILPGLKKADAPFLNTLQEDSYDISFEKNLQKLAKETKVQLILGRYDHVVGYKQQLNMFQNNENANITLLSLAGHNIMIDQPDFIYFFFDQFLKSLNANK